jgi:hypothetical protein
LSRPVTPHIESYNVRRGAPWGRRVRALGRAPFSKINRRPADHIFECPHAHERARLNTPRKSKMVNAVGMLVGGIENDISNGAPNNDTHPPIDSDAARASLPGGVVCSLNSFRGSRGPANNTPLPATCQRAGLIGSVLNLCC